jgi:hypothetical protein
MAGFAVMDGMDRIYQRHGLRDDAEGKHSVAEKTLIAHSTGEFGYGVGHRDRSAKSLQFKIRFKTANSDTPFWIDCPVCRT